jgi:hypothetical protein
MIGKKKGGLFMSLSEQLEYVKKYFPQVWEYFQEQINGPKLPRFDDNDDWITDKEERQ